MPLVMVVEVRKMWTWAYSQPQESDEGVLRGWITCLEKHRLQLSRPDALHLAKHPSPEVNILVSGTLIRDFFPHLLLTFVLTADRRTSNCDTLCSNSNLVSCPKRTLRFSASAIPSRTRAA